MNGDDSTISERANHGFDLVNSTVSRALCHDGWRLTDNSFHAIDMDTVGPGCGQQLPNTPNVTHAFKSPGLCNIYERGLFMHSGPTKTLRKVVVHYSDGEYVRNMHSATEGRAFDMDPRQPNDTVTWVNAPDEKR